MKMIFAIVHKEDEGFVVERLNKERISVTKLASTGGFLRKGNATLMIGTEDDKVEMVLQVIKARVFQKKRDAHQPHLFGRNKRSGAGIFRTAGHH